MLPLQAQFQLTHSRGVRQITGNCACLFKDFNSRTHVECDVLPLGSRQSDWNFNSRTHVECDGFLRMRRMVLRNFNSRTHVECDLPRWLGCCNRRISTHALTWSATPDTSEWSLPWQISTHALTWSATQTGRSLQQQRPNFNSRTHVECDRI